MKFILVKWMISGDTLFRKPLSVLLSISLCIYPVCPQTWGHDEAPCSPQTGFGGDGIGWRKGVESTRNHGFFCCFLLVFLPRVSTITYGCSMLFLCLSPSTNLATVATWIVDEELVLTWQHRHVENQLVVDDCCSILGWCGIWKWFVGCIFSGSLILNRQCIKQIISIS